MKFTFPDGQIFHVRKIPHEDKIEARIVGKKLLYERLEQGVKRLTEDTDDREAYILSKILQYFIPQKKHNRHWRGRDSN